MIFLSDQEITLTVDHSKIRELLGADADMLLNHHSETIPKEKLYLPGGDFIDRVVSQSDRGPRVLRSLQSIFGNGRLGCTGYVSILPVDQGVEHSAGRALRRTRIISTLGI